jgi:hypothetical protein
VHSNVGRVLPPEIAPEFGRLYRDKGLPRFAVYLNRELSDEVTAWVTDTRMVMNAQVRKQTESKAESSKETDVALAVQRQRGDTARDMPDEGWSWEFEEGFTRPLLANGVRLTDRAVMLRLMGAKDRRGSGDLHSPNPKALETQGLSEYADVLVELLVRREPTSVCGYDFRATAKQIADGRILAMASSRSWDSKQLRQKKQVAVGADGYETCRDLPAPGDVARLLVVDLTEGLRGAWAASTQK